MYNIDVNKINSYYVLYKFKSLIFYRNSLNIFFYTLAMLEYNINFEDKR